jgi:type IV pilus assembly protein PilE
MKAELSLLRGFTLLELLIATLLVGVLAAIALPSYTAYIQRSARSEARGQLLEAALWIERERVQFGRYDRPLAAGTQVLPVVLQCSPRDPAGAGSCRDYSIGFEAVDVAAYVLRAVPVAGGRMAADECGLFRLDHTGLRTHTGRGTVDLCLNR